MDNDLIKDKSKYLDLKNIKNISEYSKLETAGQIIRDGGLVLFPTETVYGLGANGLDPEAVKKIYATKGRSSDNPLILHISDIEMLGKIAKDISDIEFKLMNAFWPGPFTIILNKNFKKGLKLLDETKISEVLGLKYNEDITFTVDILGMLSQIEVKQIEYTKEEKDNIAKIKEIINQNRINNFTLFNYGLYLSYVAGDVLHINKQTINKIYKNLPIKSMKDIDITGKEVMTLLNLEPSKKVSEIINDVKIEICGD